MTQLSHEFSHIYLHSRRDPQSESEWATDLCALMMGFAPLWRQGRKHTSTQKNATQTITSVHTQGYLSDNEFDFAVNYIDQLRSPFEQLRKQLSSTKQRIQLICNDISKYLEDVCLLYNFHYTHPQKLFKHAEDAKIFSKLAQSHYKSEIEELLAKSKSETNVIVKPLLFKNEFYDKDIKWLENNLEQLNAIEIKLNQKLVELKHYYEIIIKNIDTDHYNRIFNARVAAISDSLNDADKKIQKIYKEMKVLSKCLACYNQYKKESIVNEKDVKTLSLICKTDYFAASEEFIRKEQKKIEGIKAVLKEAHNFYSVDDEILSSRIGELKDVISTLDYCLKEQKDNLKVVMRNLSFIGKTKWTWNHIMSRLVKI